MLFLFLLQIEENTRALSKLQHASIQEENVQLEGTSPAAKKPRSMALERFRMGAKKAMLMWAQKAVTEYVYFYSVDFLKRIGGSMAILINRH